MHIDPSNLSRLVRLLPAVALVLLLAGCNSDGSTADDGTPVIAAIKGGWKNADDPAEKPGNGNGGSQSGGSKNADPEPGAPVIGGTPPATATVHQAYGFTPTASDPNGLALTFSIANRPSWAQFDGSTGTLSGTPGQADKGTHGGIVITASNGQYQTSLPAFEIIVNDGGTHNVTLNWQPPTELVDGSALTDLAGIRLHYGRASGEYEHTIDVGHWLTSYVVEGLQSGTWYFSATALRSNNLESGFAEEIRHDLF